jgi:colanic acid/amylovoran biosynthesis glycosyltransferase
MASLSVGCAGPLLDPRLGCLRACPLVASESGDVVNIDKIRVGYVLSEYPKVSHTFIRREILALEAAGVSVERLAIRASSDSLPDPVDRNEATKTRYALGVGPVAILTSLIEAFFKAPVRFLRAFLLATKLGVRSERPLPVHWVYLVEAAVISRWVRELRIDHLHAHFGSNPTEVAMLAGVLSEVPYSFTAHGTVETDNARAIGIAEKVARAAFVVAVSHYGRAQLLRWVAISEWPKVHVVRCGLGADFLDSPNVAPPDRRRLLVVGRISAEKGHLVLLDAASVLRDRRADFELIIAGDGPLRSEMEGRIAGAKLSDRVSITGWVSSAEVIELLRSSRALVLPSFAEGLPVVLMEAFAMGRPVVATWVAGIPELVGNESSGWLVPPGNVKLLADALQDCLQRSDEDVLAMGRVGQLAVRGLHDVRIETVKLASLFRATIAATR